MKILRTKFLFSKIYNKLAAQIVLLALIILVVQHALYLLIEILRIFGFVVMDFIIMVALIVKVIIFLINIIFSNTGPFLD